MALSAERNTLAMGIDAVISNVVYPVAAGVTIYKGALVALNGGYAAPGSTATGLIAAGRAEETVDNSAGAAGAATVRVRRGVFKFSNDATDPIAQANVGGTAYIVDDETVAATDGNGTRSAAGKILKLDADGVWVEII